MPTLCVFVMAIGSFEETALLQPGRAGHFAVAVEREPGAEHRIRVGLAARVHDRDTGAYRAFADYERTTAGDQRGVTDLYARHIGDGIERTRSAANGQAQLARA